MSNTGWVIIQAAAPFKVSLSRIRLAEIWPAPACSCFHYSEGAFFIFFTLSPLPMISGNFSSYATRGKTWSENWHIHEKGNRFDWIGLALGNLYWPLVRGVPVGIGRWQIVCLRQSWFAYIFSNLKTFL